MNPNSQISIMNHAIVIVQLAPHGGTANGGGNGRGNPGRLRELTCNAFAILRSLCRKGLRRAFARPRYFGTQRVPEPQKRYIGVSCALTRLGQDSLYLKLPRDARVIQRR